ncbi:PQQ-binding-like beta-propeller repeat protein [Streptomyces sp. SLBN-8D4]|uniref:outer membrane protein assembly factor BamB family protein n=1 Tax=Streptomyces sp. SLBN-8D4 TaxID=3377728 RepID=UPI003C7C1401
MWSRSSRLRPHARQPVVHDGTLLTVDGHILYAFDAASGEPLWQPKSMGYDNQPPVDGTIVFTSAMGNILRPRDIRSGKEVGPRIDQCAAGQAVCDRGTLYVPDLHGILQMYDTASGRHLWSWPLKPHASGFLETPRVAGDSVFVTWSGSSASRPWTLQALDTEARRPRWTEPIRLASPQYWLASPDRVHVIGTEPGEEKTWLRTYDVHDGALLRRQQLPGPLAGKPTASPKTLHLAHQDGRVSSWNALTGEHRWTGRSIQSSSRPPGHGGRDGARCILGPGPSLRAGRCHGDNSVGRACPADGLLRGARLRCGQCRLGGKPRGSAPGLGSANPSPPPGYRRGVVVGSCPAGHAPAVGRRPYIATKNGSLHAIRLEEDSV